MDTIRSVLTGQKEALENCWPLVATLLEPDTTIFDTDPDSKGHGWTIDPKAIKMVQESLNRIEEGKFYNDIPPNPKTTEEQDAASLGQNILKWFLDLF